MIPPDMLQTVWCAATRHTKSGRVLGGAERVSVYDALQAVTLHAAQQYGEQDQKGSIAPGKRADFVILDRDPLAVAPDEVPQPEGGADHLWRPDDLSERIKDRKRRQLFKLPPFSGIHDTQKGLGYIEV